MSVFMRLLQLVGPYRKSIALAMLLSFLTLGSSLALMAMSAYLISRASLVTDVSQLWIAIASVRLFAILRAVFRYFERVISHRTTFRILAHLRGWFFSSIEPLAPARLSQHRTGDLVARSVADIEMLENFYIRVLVPPISAGLAVAFACAILGLFDFRLALILLVFLITTGVVLPLTVRWLGQRTAAMLVSIRAELSATVTDQIQGGADLLIFDQQQRHQKRTLSLNEKLIRVQERLACLRSASNALAALFASLAGLSVLWVGISLVTGGDLDGVFLALLPLTAIASFEAVQPLPAAIQQLESSQAAGRRLFDLIDAPAEITVPIEPALMPLRMDVTFDSVSFRYADGEKLALDNVSFTVPEGSCTAIVGPSGSGKTTIANLLLRFWELQSDSITIGNHDLRDYCADDVRELLGVVPQDIYLFNATIRDNLLLANQDATDEQLAAATRTALLDDFIESLPGGYDTMVGENGLLLSGGERQRLAIARVILKDAPIVILDEPTANLDAITERRLFQSLQPFLAQRTTLIISHRRIATSYADQVIWLDQGRVVNQTHRNSRPAYFWSTSASRLS